MVQKLVRSLVCNVSRADISGALSVLLSNPRHENEKGRFFQNFLRFPQRDCDRILIAFLVYSLSFQPSSFICETQQYCVDPSAKWLPEKLKVLEEVSLENLLEILFMV